ncbi:hypothetical protein GH714_025519 [Hevea brasiliensis]|uniref:Uncharacterized protein n=1 Tax=Hevea brasiliensis TaxID=3981 RepID=A0A6A6KKR2_HEVBR|nr:hypothetical protein GH714_025519 [Hevea brasiliensis]
MHDFGDHKGGDLPYDRQRDVFSCYGRERFSDNHFRDVCRKHTRTKYHRSVRDEIKPKERRTWNESDLHERSFRLDDREDMDRDWDCGGRGLSPEGLIPDTYRDSRRLVTKYNNFKQTDIQWGRKGDKIQSRKRTNYDAFLSANKNVDDLMLQKYGRLVTNRKGDSLDEQYDSHIPFFGRETNLHGRRVRYDDHWILNQQHLSTWSHRESYAANEERWKDMMSPRKEMFDVADRHERIHAKYRSTNGWMVDDMQLEWHRRKMFEGESSAGFRNRNSYMMSRGEYEQTSGRCNDPVDLIFGEGKAIDSFSINFAANLLEGDMILEIKTPLLSWLSL